MARRPLEVLAAFNANASHMAISSITLADRSEFERVPVLEVQN